MNIDSENDKLAKGNYIRITDQYGRFIKKRQALVQNEFRTLFYRDINGRRHRWDGPAIERLDGLEPNEYFIHGVKTSKEDYEKWQFQQEVNLSLKEINPNLDIANL